MALTSIAPALGRGYDRGMWWRKTEKPLRQQLQRAKVNLTRQIQIMGAGTIRGFGYQPGSVEELQEQLREINQALANLGPDDA
jgi:hypothetical protein